MGWHDGPVQRSFDAMQFLNTTENGVIWRGMIASYPQLVPQELVRASRLSMQRLLVNRGELSSPSSLAWGSQALGFAVYQNENGKPCCCYTCGHLLHIMFCPHIFQFPCACGRIFEVVGNPGASCTLNVESHCAP
jgi:hypothetical protein